jgi:hypothetical protein
VKEKKVERTVKLTREERLAQRIKERVEEANRLAAEYEAKLDPRQLNPTR